MARMETRKTKVDEEESMEFVGIFVMREKAYGGATLACCNLGETLL